MQAFHPVKEVSGKPGYEAPTIEENKGGVMGFMNYWTSDRKIKPAQIENIELYSMILNSIHIPAYRTSS